MTPRRNKRRIENAEGCSGCSPKLFQPTQHTLAGSAFFTKDQLSLVTYLEFSSSIILLILLLALSDFSALAQAGWLADDLISSSCGQHTNKRCKNETFEP